MARKQARKKRAGKRAAPVTMTTMNARQAMDARRDFIVELLGLKDKAARIGFWRTYRAMDKVTQVVGYEFADIMEAHLKATEAVVEAAEAVDLGFKHEREARKRRSRDLRRGAKHVSLEYPLHGKL